MASVKIDSGELPSAVGIIDSYELSQVVGRWQSIAHGRFRDDCRFLLQMIEETDRLRLWEKNVGGFTYANRDEFLQKKVLIDYDLTERQTRQIVDALRAGKSGGIAELVASVEPADTHGGKRDGAGRPSIADMVQAVEPAKVHDGNNQDANGNLNNRKTKGSHKSETIIARLKRDAETDTHAAALLGSIEAGDLKPYRAAVEMGWVKPPDPLAIIDRHFDKLDVADQVKVWEEWGRALPGKSVDRVAIAVEALLNCTEREQRQAWQQVRAMTGSAAHC